MSSVTEIIAELKHKVKVIISEVNGLKVKLQERKITLEEFREKKDVLENTLRGILEEISQYKDEDVGTEETRHDAYIAEEANRLMYEFQTEFGMEYISKPRVYISASLDDHFIFQIDFTDYPAKPILTNPRFIQKLFEVPLESRLEILNNWDASKPNHIVEVFYAIENVLLNIFRSEEMEEEGLNLEMVGKIYKKKKILTWADHNRDTYNTGEAIKLYREVIQISHELEDFEGAKRYAEIIEDLQKHEK